MSKKSILFLFIMFFYQSHIIAFEFLPQGENLYQIKVNQLIFNNMSNQKFYCEYCGADYTSVQALTRNKCSRHPEGAYKGNHKLYEGGEKSKYTCKYCGSTFSTISSMTRNKCTRHPNGVNKGNHSPAL